MRYQASGRSTAEVVRDAHLPRPDADDVVRFQQLEPLATALFVARENAGRTVEERVQRLREIKQHIDEPFARRAVADVDEWLGEVRPR